ncbi:short integuments 2, mitochondrial-like isoform X1 [Triticum dicoccoides]|uniref:short integuments 2, mitochondrial-like isoform X1 n=1 Tax=Triticum dicoccoides TaxID=85692 RepID=UPI00162BCB69|nr:short integuments 2, mitochondrial-like isoform X1 [Triticum dicoccoides]XP_037432008.1 short integuments 2, mitochondrial-like isoform X1 [Triticum dicoccoides]
MRGLTRAGKRASDMAFNAGGGAINWFPGHMAAASRAIRDRLKLADLVIEVRDARIPLSSANEDLQPVLSAKRRILALNKKDLANPNIMNMWLDHFQSSKQDCISLNAHSSNSINQLLGLVELKLREAILKEPTLLVMVVGVPNVGKSALINSIHRIANSRFPVNDKMKRARVGPLPGVTQDIAGYKIASQPSIYVLDTPGVLVPSIPDMETGLKLALTGAVKDSVVGEERIAKYLLSLLNIRKTPLHWERLLHRREEFDEDPDDSCEKGSRGSLRRRQRFNNSDALYVQDLVIEVQRTLCSTAMEFTGNLDEDNELESLIDSQLVALRKVFRIPHKPLDESHGPASKKLLTLFRSGKLGPFILDDLPDKQ